MAIAVRHRTLDGSMKKSIMNPGMPNIKLSSKYLTPAQRNQLASLSMIDDTFLSFQCRDDWQAIVLKVTPTALNQIVLPSMSNLKLSKVLVDAGFSSVITIDRVDEIPNPTIANTYDSGGYGEGGYDIAEHYAGGSYDDSSYTITPGTLLTTLDPVYVTFTYKGWLVDIDKFTSTYKGDNIEWFSYDFQLTSA
jgi:hypothetical protein